MTLLLAAPAAGTPPPPRDAVIGQASASTARISAGAAAARYPIEDGSGATIAVAVTASCQATCTAADPRRIAGFVGTLIHGPEIELLTVQLDTPAELEFDCGYGVHACYYPGENRIVLSGNDAPAADGASREYVLAHEYGHHVANHRESVAPFPLAIDWGTPRWSSHEQVCAAQRRGAFFPGDEGSRYERNPGEAFAEAFARYRFPDAGVRWAWAPSLRPDAEALRAIREDTLSPWEGRTRIRLVGPARPAGRRGLVRSFSTPLDGRISLLPATGTAPPFAVSLWSVKGRILRSSEAVPRAEHGLNFTVCGQSRLRVVFERRRGARHPAPLLVDRP
ncbi:MAG TPA: hypothetical protein VFY04_11770 [Solirubrobacterales bacterium]|nr:hypothetical protein [Solirubrobacterales bacterium]